MSRTELASAVAQASYRQALDELLELVHPDAAEDFKRRQRLVLEAVPWHDLKQRAGPRAKRLQQAIQAADGWRSTLDGALAGLGTAGLFVLGAENIGRPLPA